MRSRPLFFMLVLLTALCTAVTVTPSVRATEAKPEPFKRVLEIIGPNIHTADAQTVPSTTLASSDYLVIYFSAAWCPPCQKFTPELVKFNKEHQKDNNFRILLASSDQSEEKMYEYMTKAQMGWHAVTFDRDRLKALRDAYAGGSGIPDMVIIDREGKVVSAAYENGRYVGPRKVLRDLGQLVSPANPA